MSDFSALSPYRYPSPCAPAFGSVSFRLLLTWPSSAPSAVPLWLAIVASVAGSGSPRGCALARSRSTTLVISGTRNGTALAPTVNWRTLLDRVTACTCHEEVPAGRTSFQLIQFFGAERG